jgi:shikimate dehydrogenase
MTDLYCVMGNPIAHSRSPAIHARFAQLTGQAMAYEKREVPLMGFAQAVKAFQAEGGRGCNITVPFKFEAAALVDGQTERAQLAQAANTLSFLNGRIEADTTDGVGLVTDIQSNVGLPLKGRRILLLGAGGAAASVLGALLQAQPACVVVTNRTRARAQALVQRHREWALLSNTKLLEQNIYDLEADFDQKFDVLINATAASLAGADLALNPAVIEPGALAYDMMYGPAAQAFLSWSQSHGAQPRDGLGMLVEQAAASFEIWRGVRPPAGQVLAEMRAAHGALKTGSQLP